MNYIPFLFELQLQNCNNQQMLQQQNIAEKREEKESLFPLQDNVELLEKSVRKESQANDEQENDIEQGKENIQDNRIEIKLSLNKSFVKENSSQVSPIYEAVMLSPLNLRRNNNSNILEESNITSQTSIQQQDSLKDVSLKHEMSPTTMKQRLRLYKANKLQDSCTEREQRRKYRVEKKLLQIHQNSHEILGEVSNNDIQFDIMEFISNYFNIHEKPQSNDIIATLTRKNKKNINLMSNAEMIYFNKHDKIPTSHVHMYDPENVVLACDIFHVS